MDPLRPISTGRKLALARELRRNPTPIERHSWSLLRNRAILGLKFRRQHVVHGFIVDFYCAELRLVLELDGDHHREPTGSGYDAARSQVLAAAGYHVIRIQNRELTRERIMEAVRTVLTNLNFGSPSPHGGEGVRG
jgi:very-short-patch-repair endonuclease